MMMNNYQNNTTLIPIIQRPKAVRIGLIADTHVPDRSPGLNPKIKDIFQGVDLILHAGDISSPKVLAELGKIAETIAVQGNNLGDKILFDPPLPRKIILEVAEGVRIGLVHGLLNIFQRVADVTLGRLGFSSFCSGRLIQRVKPLFDNVDGIVYGHGHYPVIKHEEGRLYINPGLAFGEKWSSCACLEIYEKNIRIHFAPLSDANKYSHKLQITREFSIPNR